jgi:6-phosphofructo-2-kinase/fructose-2,6-biphosphatase 2
VKRYLGWISIRAEVFNVGKYRREATPHPDANFFDMSNPDGEKARRAAAEAAVDDMLHWFEDRSNTVAILDATNSTKSRRRWIYDRLRASGIEGPYYKLLAWLGDSALTAFWSLIALFVESKCDDDAVIMNNIIEVKTTSPDYVG